MAQAGRLKGQHLTTERPEAPHWAWKLGPARRSDPAHCRPKGQGAGASHGNQRRRKFGSCISPESLTLSRTFWSRLICPRLRRSATHNFHAVVLTRRCSHCMWWQIVGSCARSVHVLRIGQQRSSLSTCIWKSCERSRSTLPNGVFNARFHTETGRRPSKTWQCSRGNRNFPSTDRVRSVERLAVCQGTS
jgi:hypothetical protein